MSGAALIAACGGDGNGPSNTPPTAAFTTPVACTLLVCNFDGSSSTDADGSVASYAWTFGESGSSTNSGTGATTSHTYGAPATYTVTLTVTDNDGATNAVSHDVTVSNVPNTPPTAEFTSDCNSQVCQFTNTSTDNGTFTSSWNFGDGSAPSTETSPSHNYSAASGTTFTVTLTVTDNNGATATQSHDVDVSPGATLTCGSTPDCSLTLEAARHVTVTLVSSNCQLSGNTFKVTITTPGNAPVEETLFTDGCNQTANPPGKTFQLQTNAVFAAGTTIQAEVISGGTTLEIPPALRLAAGSTYPTWTLEFDDGAKAVEPPNGAPDFDDLVIRIDAIP
jgi:PKD repeat protein